MLRLADEIRKERELSVHVSVRLHLRVISILISSLLTPGKFCIIAVKCDLQNIKHKAVRVLTISMQTNAAPLICMQPAHVTAFGSKYRNESGPESFPSPPLTVVPVCCGCVFFELSLCGKTKILSGAIFSLPNHPYYCMSKLCEYFSDFFLLLL